MDLKKRAEEIAQEIYEQTLPLRLEEWDALSDAKKQPFLETAAREVAAEHFSAPIGKAIEEGKSEAEIMEAFTAATKAMDNFDNLPEVGQKVKINVAGYAAHTGIAVGTEGKIVSVTDDDDFTLCLVEFSDKQTVYYYSNEFDIL